MKKQDVAKKQMELITDHITPIYERLDELIPAWDKKYELVWSPTDDRIYLFNIGTEDEMASVKLKGEQIFLDEPEQIVLNLVAELRRNQI
jgi:hypothetical protein